MNRDTLKWGIAVITGAGLIISAGISTAEEKIPREYLNNFKPITQKIVPNPENPVTPAKIRLGKMLYHDARLSKSGFLSCNSCHSIASYGMSNLPSDIGHKWAVGPINSGTVFNSAFNFVQFWNGRAKDLEEQAKGPILNPAEMGMPDEASVVKKMSSIPGYRKLFEKAFPDEKEPLTYNNIAKAIAAFERTLLTPSRFDKFLKGDKKALSDQEKKGLRLFVDTGCAGCHNGIGIGGGSFQKMGLVKPYETANKGRFEVTNKEEDMYVFKVPILRNIEMTYPYFNDGKVWNLDEAVRIMADVELGKTLTDGEVEDLVAFLKSLTGEIPREALVLPVLPPSGRDTTRPSID